VKFSKQEKIFIFQLITAYFLPRISIRYVPIPYPLRPYSISATSLFHIRYVILNTVAVHSAAWVWKPSTKGAARNRA